MSGVQDQLMEFNIELLKKNKFCWGIGEQGKRYRCGDEVVNQDVIDSIIADLLVESVRRMLSQRVWEIWWIAHEQQEWLTIRSSIEQLRDKYGFVDEVEVRLINEFLMYLERFKEYWQSISNEVTRFINDVLHGKTEVIIRNKAQGISIYSEHIALDANKLPTSKTIILSINGFRSINIDVPNIFSGLQTDEFIKGFKLGFAATDEGYNNSHPYMVTTQNWQAVIWSLLYPGKINVHISGVNVAMNSVSIEWGLLSYEYRSLKDSVFGEAERLDERGLAGFMLSAILGDGTVNIEHKQDQDYVIPRIYITMSKTKFEQWKNIADKISIRWWAPKTQDRIYYHGSNAIKLAKWIITATPPILQDLIDALNIPKWNTLNQIANMKVKYIKGESQVEIAGVKFTVNIMGSSIELRHKAKDKDAVKKIIEILKSIYGDEFIDKVRTGKDRKYEVIRIPMSLIVKYENLKRLAIQVICRKLSDADEKKKKQLIKALMKLVPTEIDGCK